MAEPPEPGSSPSEPPRRSPDLDEIFGDVLPSTTSDERDQAPRDDRDDWYERERPPHHDDPD